jgi:hypothetical protein
MATRESKEARNLRFQKNGQRVSNAMSRLRSLSKDETGRGKGIAHDGDVGRAIEELLEALTLYYEENNGVSYDSSVHDYRYRIRSFLTGDEIPFRAAHIFLEAMRGWAMLAYHDLSRSPTMSIPDSILVKSLQGWQLSSADLMLKRLEGILSHSPVLNEHIHWMTTSLYPWNSEFERDFKPRLLKIVENTRYVLSPELLENLCYHADRDIALAASENEACPENGKAAVVLIDTSLPGTEWQE